MLLLSKYDLHPLRCFPDSRRGLVLQAVPAACPPYDMPPSSVSSSRAYNPRPHSPHRDFLPLAQSAKPLATCSSIERRPSLPTRSLPQAPPTLRVRPLTEHLMRRTTTVCASGAPRIAPFTERPVIQVMTKETSTKYCYDMPKTRPPS